MTFKRWAGKAAVTATAILLPVPVIAGTANAGTSAGTSAGTANAGTSAGTANAGTAAGKRHGPPGGTQEPVGGPLVSADDTRGDEVVYLDLNWVNRVLTHGVVDSAGNLIRGAASPGPGLVNFDLTYTDNAKAPCLQETKKTLIAVDLTPLWGVAANGRPPAHCPKISMADQVEADLNNANTR